MNGDQAAAPAARKAAQRISDPVSRRIAIARVICILAVIYVHSPPYGDRVPTMVMSVDGVTWIMREILARSSVPLLSIVSGFLTVRLDTGGYGDRLRKKVKTLLVPLLLWNLIAVAKDCVTPGGQLPPLAALPQLLLGIDGNPRIYPLYFLRDIFVCNLLLPAFLFGIGRWPRLTLALLLANAVTNADLALFTNSAIPLFFAVGLALGAGRLTAERMVRRPALWAGCAALVLAAIAATPFVFGVSARSWPGIIENGVVVVQRVAGAILFWQAAGLAMNRAAGRIARRIEPIIFFVFCSHPLLLGAAWLVYQVPGLDAPPATVLLFFFASPLIVVMLSIIAIAVLAATLPWLLKALMAGRIPTWAQLRALVTMRDARPPTRQAPFDKVA
jgi:fucose 4-O-acetylase-like acetyltransferase